MLSRSSRNIVQILAFLWIKFLECVTFFCPVIQSYFLQMNQRWVKFHSTILCIEVYVLEKNKLNYYRLPQTKTLLGLIRETSGSHGSQYEDGCLLGDRAWRWKQLTTLNLPLTSAKLHGATTQKTAILGTDRWSCDLRHLANANI
jgi:hypothetical protein